MAKRPKYQTAHGRSRDLFGPMWGSPETPEQRERLERLRRGEEIVPHQESWCFSRHVSPYDALTEYIGGKAVPDQHDDRPTDRTSVWWWLGTVLAIAHREHRKAAEEVQRTLGPAPFDYDAAIEKAQSFWKRGSVFRDSIAAECRKILRAPIKPVTDDAGHHHSRYTLAAELVNCAHQAAASVKHELTEMLSAYRDPAGYFESKRFIKWEVADDGTLAIVDPESAVRSARILIKRWGAHALLSPDVQEAFRLDPVAMREELREATIQGRVDGRRPQKSKTAILFEWCDQAIEIQSKGLSTRKSAGLVARLKLIEQQGLEISERRLLEWLKQAAEEVDSTVPGSMNLLLHPQPSSRSDIEEIAARFSEKR